MVALIRTDKTRTEIEPNNGNKFTLEELQEYVGGHIECPRLPDGSVMILNEEGKIRGLPINYSATQIWIDRFGVSSDVILGDVVLMNKEEWKAWNVLDEEE